MSLLRLNCLPHLQDRDLARGLLILAGKNSSVPWAHQCKCLLWVFSLQIFQMVSQMVFHTGILEGSEPSTWVDFLMQRLECQNFCLCALAVRILAMSLDSAEKSHWHVWVWGENESNMWGWVLVEALEPAGVTDSFCPPPEGHWCPVVAEDHCFEWQWNLKVVLRSTHWNWFLRSSCRV